MKRKRPNELAALREEVARLREEVAALKAAPRTETHTHNHYHFGDGGFGQPARNPYAPVTPQWPGPLYTTVTCDGSSKHEYTTSAPLTVPGVIVLTQGGHRE